MGKAKRIDLLKKSFKSNKVVQKPKNENPFDKFANARKKFDILNRKVKGEDRNVGRARAKAIDERKKKLLSEIKQSKRSNEIIDKRFGENDPSISLEEKLFLRFQRDRMKKARNSSLFNLDEEKSEFLTHKGSILGESNIHDTDWVSDDEDGNGKIHKDVVNKLHFGGGLVPKQNQAIPEEEEKEQTKKSRLDALQEIVMKSKYFKMQRKEAKEEQETERKRLDDAFEELFSANVLEYDSDKDKKLRKMAAKGETPDEDDYDQKMREMMFEPKVQPSDRLKTQEELAIETKERIEKLERDRLRRMRRSALDESDEKDLKSARNKRKRNDDELDEIDFGNDRNSYKANGQDEESDKDADEEEDFEDYDEEMDGSDEEGNYDEDEDSENFDDDEEEDGEDEEDIDDDDEEDGGEFDEDEEDEDEHPIKEAALPAQKLHSRASDSQTIEEMPHKVSCPNTIDEFMDLMSRYCKSSGDRIELTQRILLWNNVHLPGEEGKENKRKMHNFLNTLLKYFISLGDSIREASSEEELSSVWEELHALTGFIFQIAQDLQKTCIPLFSRTIKIIHDQNQKNFRDYQLGEQSTCLMSLGKLLFFQLISHIFSTSDVQNPIVNVSIMILTQQLTQCPIKSSREFYQGLITAKILLSSFTSLETKKLIPDVVTFLASVVTCFLPRMKTLFPSSSSSDPLLQNIYYHRDFYRSYRHYVLNNIKYARLSSLRSLLSDFHQNQPPASKDSEDNQDVAIEWKYFAESITAPEGEILDLILRSTYHLITDFVLPLYSNSNAFPELVHPLYCMLQQMVPHQKPVLSDAVQSSHCHVLELLKGAVEKVEGERKPLMWREQQGDTVEAKTPKYHLNYILKRDRAEYDSNNSERLQLKQLTRQLKREQKAAMRELRRDAGFIEQEQYQQRQAKLEKLKQERQKNYQWLEEQQATINLQVRKGKGLMKGGGSFVAKKPRISR